MQRADIGVVWLVLGFGALVLIEAVHLYDYHRVSAPTTPATLTGARSLSTTQLSSTDTLTGETAHPSAAAAAPEGAARPAAPK